VATTRLRGSQAPTPTAARERLVLRIVIFGAAATIAAGVGIRAFHGGLGTSTPPFVAAWAPALDPLAAVSVAVLLASVWLAPRLLAARVAPALFSLGAFGFALAMGLALNVARRGTGAWTGVFDLGPGGSSEATNEYLAGLPSLSYGARFYLDRFAELVPAQPVHVAGHPPGPLLLVHVLGIDTAGGLTALCVGMGAAGAPLTYALARSLTVERTARLAGLLYSFSPATLLFGVTSMDYLFATLGVGTAALLVARRRSAVALGVLLVPVAALFSWALLGVASWALLVVGARDGIRRALILGIGCAVAIVALNGVLAAVWGYDPLGALRATNTVYGHSIASIRPYAFWLFGSPVAWGVMLGLPIAAAAVRSAVRRDVPSLALAAVVILASVGGFTKAETERIWLIFVPLACVAAAPVLAERRLRLVLAALALQAVAVQLLFGTLW
jgi:hypothetical protein